MDDLMQFVDARLADDATYLDALGRHGQHDCGHRAGCLPDCIAHVQRTHDARAAMLRAIADDPSDPLAEVTLRALASIYQDHPDYDATWSLQPEETPEPTRPDTEPEPA
jgi:hypothetical protein